MHVQLSIALQAVILGAPLTLMLALNVWLKRRCRRPSHVSTVKRVEKMLASLAP
jgi:hypothetical protein